MFEVQAIRTKRLILRKLKEADTPNYFLLRSSPDVMLYLQRPLAQSEEEVREQICEQLQAQEEGRLVVWAIANLTDELIGLAGYWRMQLAHQRAEVGYMLLPQYHGQGYASEALREILAFGFNQLKLHKIEADVDPKNTASLRLLERFGFKPEALFRDNRFYQGEFYDSCWLGLLREEWENHCNTTLMGKL